MTLFEKVIECMRTEPDYEWSATEIAAIIFSDPQKHRENCGKVSAVLKQAEKYRVVRRTGVKRASWNNVLSNAWMLI